MSSSGQVPFVHLHDHSEYSALDGGSRIAEMAGLLKEYGMDAMGLTDHGVMQGLPEFQEELEKEGIKSILGIEAYLTNDRNNHNQRETPTWHLTLIAENNQGYQNLCKLSSWAFIEGRITTFGRPRARADWDLLERYSEGVICLTGCMAGPVMSEIFTNGDVSKAKERAERLVKVYGADNVYGELQNFGIATGIPADSEAALLLGKAALSAEEASSYRDPNGDLSGEVQAGEVPITQIEACRILVEEICKPLGIKYAATGDVHYLRKDDADPHDAMICIGTGQLKKGERRFSLLPKQYHLRSYEEMQEALPHWPESLAETVNIADRCSARIEYGKELLPRFPIPQEFSGSADFLRNLCEEGLDKLYPKGSALRDDAVDRLEMELGVIESMGFNDYFLIVWDLLREAKERNIPYGPGRGSAAGSIVSYTLGITQVDPLSRDLLFERFLNPDRISMPDIDLDFGVAPNKEGVKKRDELIEYAKYKYNNLAGCDTAVTQIVTFTKFKAKGALRDAARVLAEPDDAGRAHGVKLGDKLASCIPDDPRATMRSVWKDQEQGKQLRAAHKRGGAEAEAIEQAGWMEGLVKTYGTHAAAVLIADHDLTDDLPLQQMKDDKPYEVQYDMGYSEDLGLLKMDFLGIRNLDVIWDTIEKIKHVRGIDIGDPWHDIPLDDQRTYEMLARGESMGVFQYESAGMITTLRQIRPTEFDDLVAIVALYRPGAMSHIGTYADGKHGRATVTYLDPRLEGITENTYGVCLYQEQNMRIAREIAGFTPGQADDLRKAIGKKLKDKMDSLKPLFMDGCKENGVEPDVAEKLWADNEAAADYSFNKSHADCYALISYVTAYLKANFSEEYSASLLSSVMGVKDKPRMYLTEAKRMNITVLPPDINRSLKDFAVLEGEEGGLELLFGLTAIRGVGAGIVAEVVAERDARGPFKSMFSLIRRMPQLNKTLLGSLIRGGALDSLHTSRKQMAEAVEPAIEKIKKQRKQAEKEQVAAVREYVENHPRPSDEVTGKGKRKLSGVEKEGIKGGALFALDAEGFPAADTLEEPVYEALVKKECSLERSELRRQIKESGQAQQAVLAGILNEESAEEMSEKAQIEAAAREKVSEREDQIRAMAIDISGSVEGALKATADKMAEEVGIGDALKQESDPKLSGEEWPELTMLNYEREMLGVYVTGHPLDKDTRKWAYYVDKGLGHIGEEQIDKQMKVAGAMVGKKPITTKRGDRMYKIWIEDLTGSREVTIFPKTAEGIEEMLEVGNVLALDVKVEEDTFAAAKQAESEDDEGEEHGLDEEGKPVQLIAGRVYNWDPTKLPEPKKNDPATVVVEDETITVQISSSTLTKELISSLRELASRSPGNHRLRFVVDKEHAISTELEMEASEETLSELKQLRDQH